MKQRGARRRAPTPGLLLLQLLVALGVPAVGLDLARSASSPERRRHHRPPTPWADDVAELRRHLSAWDHFLARHRRRDRGAVDIDHGEVVGAAGRHGGGGGHGGSGRGASDGLPPPPGKSGAVPEGDAAVAAGGAGAALPVASVFVINLDEKSYAYRGFLAHTSRALGISSSAIVRSPGVLADDATLQQPWAQKLIPGMTYARRGHRGALGLALAHLSAWQHVAAAPGCQGESAQNSYALVFEDDERVDDDFLTHLRSIVDAASHSTPRPDFVNLNVLRPTGKFLRKVGRAHLLKAGGHAERGLRPNVWGSVYLLRCGSASALVDEVRRMRYYGAQWDGVSPLMDVVIQDLFSRRQSKLTEWVVSPSQAISYHSEAKSTRRSIDRTEKSGNRFLR